MQQALQRWCSGAGIKFVDAEAEQAYKQRAGRIADVIQLKTPDRVPVVPSFGMFPALDHGHTCQEVMFDYDKAQQAWMKTLLEFEPDLYYGSGYAFSGSVIQTLDYNLLKIPGYGVPAESIYQFAERECISAEDFYDAYLDDPTDFMLRTYLPRVCGALAPLKDTRPIRESFGYYQGMFSGVLPFITPEFIEMLAALQKAAAESQKFVSHVAQEGQKAMAMGYPFGAGGCSAAPFDQVGDWFRGTRGTMLDMYRQPDKLLAVMEKMVPICIEMGVAGAMQTGNPLVGLMLHKGSEGFMSNEQFETFYWPTLRKVMLGLIDRGLIPMPLFEGKYTSRLEIIKDIPRAKAVYWFETVDIHKAKEVLGDIACFRGNVPVSLLYAGTPQQVRAYVKELIDVVGEDGGLIVDCGIWFDEARHENVKAMVDYTKEYGVYG